MCLLAGCFDGGTIATCAITCSVDQDCPDGLACSPEGRCSEQGEVCTCDANTFLRCNSTTSAQLCVADGSHSEGVDCVTSCIDNLEGPHCSHVVPQFVPAVCDLPAVEPERTIAGTVSTDDNATCSEVISQGSDEPELCVMHAGTLTIANPNLVGKRVPVFVADGDLTVERLFVFAVSSMPGAGASGRTRGGPPSSDFVLGGDGAAFIQIGGLGGRRLITPEPDPFPTTAFHGGNSAASEGAVLGGGAGGSTMVISCQGRVTVEGPIDAGGGGGTGGRGSISAAGGGSGGRILIEGMNVTIAVTGALWANGGGGGGGVSGGNGVSGGDALQDNRASPGGGSGAVLGGDGGFLEIVPTGGGAGTVAGTQGGGGGSVGLIEIAVPNGSLVGLESSEVSPRPVVTMSLPVR
ncbi:MAG: hypothetical protein ABI867_24770 [Kofleriaceae bacterium]